MSVPPGEPFGSTSIYAQYWVFQLVREHGVTVTLDGQGADEVLDGYNGYSRQRIRSLLETERFRAAWRFLHQCADWLGCSRLAGIKRAVGVLSEGPLHALLRNFNGMGGARRSG